MSDQHTPTPWPALDAEGCLEFSVIDKSTAQPAFSVVTCSYSEPEVHTIEMSAADYRRAALCVNACAGMPTDDLEELAKIENGLLHLSAFADELKLQRDQLLAALQKLAGIKLGFVADGIVDKALAAVKGGA
jgi:hypothetical protein